MRRLLIALAILGSATANAQGNIDPKIAELCMKAQDFTGCVKTMSGGVQAQADQVEKLRDVMKQVAARLENGVSYASSTETFRPLIDQLAVTKEGNQSQLAVKVAQKAELLFNIMQEAWYNSIRYDGIAIGANDPINKWNAVIGTENIKPLKDGCFMGVCTVSTTEQKASVILMNSFIIGMLKEGTVKQAEIDSFNKAREESIRLSKMDSWNKHLAQNPTLAAWAKANPSIAAVKQKEYNAANPVEEVKLPTYTETLRYLSAFKPSLL